MPRPKKLIKMKPRTVQLPEELDRKIELLLMDPATGRAKFGAWSELVEALLTEWLNTQIKQHRT